MASAYDAQGYVPDPPKYSQLTLEERRELVYQVSKWSNGAHDFLQSWTRKELVQILCAEMGKERKYTGTSKSKIVDHLLDVISENKARKRLNSTDNNTSQPSPPNNQGPSKRPRKNENPTRLPLALTHLCDLNAIDHNVDNAIYCPNSACRATLCREDTFCRRCSCCICHKYDDNKDPSLWLVCSSDPPHLGHFCGQSCHVECALKYDQAGISKSDCYDRLDGCFYCVSCRKVNDLLGFWRKQLLIAKDTRRVDTLCYRVLLSQKLLGETKKYQKLQEIVNLAAKKLESDVGPLFGLPVRTARGIVNRLSSGPEVQKLCASAVESLDSILSSRVSYPSSYAKMQVADASLTLPGLVSFQFLSPTSLDVVLNREHASSSSAKHLVYKFWHRKTCTKDYLMEPTHILYAPNSKFSLMDLTPATGYLLKVVSFCDAEELEMGELNFRTGHVETDAAQSLIVERGLNSATNSSSLSNPSSEGDESNNLIAYMDQIDNPSGKHSVYYKKTAPDSGKISDAASKDASDSQNTSTGIGEERRQGDSVSVLDEEGIMGEVGSARNATDHAEVQGDSTALGNENDESLKLQGVRSMQRQLNDVTSTDNGSNSTHGKEGFKDAAQPITPCKLEMSKDGIGRSCRPKSSNAEPGNATRAADKDVQEGRPSGNRSGARRVECIANVSLEREYSYCVKVVRRLECEGYIEKNFRVKFLTWYSLRASPEERRIVKVFIDTLSDDPLSLSGQLIDAFSERIFSKKPPIASSGFCTKLIH